MLLFEKFHDHAAIGQLSDLIDDFAGGGAPVDARKDTLAKSRFLELYLNPVQLNQTLGIRNMIAGIPAAMGMINAVNAARGTALPSVAAKSATAPEPVEPVKPLPPPQEAPEPPVSTAVPSPAPKPSTAPQPKIKLAFDENNPATVEAYFTRPIKGNEGPDGHVIERHVAKTETELRDRLQRSKRIRASSSFPDAPTAERIIHETLVREKKQILEWIQNPRSAKYLELEYRGKDTIGVSARRDGSFENCTTATVVLMKDDQGGFYYFTAYPCD